MKRFIKCFGFWFLGLFYLEIVYKLAVFHTVSGLGILYTALFTFIYSFLFTSFTVFLTKKIKFPVMGIVLGLITLIFIAESLFYKIFDTTFSFYSLNLANQAFDFGSIILTLIKENIITVILMFVPFVLFIIFRKKIFVSINLKRLPIFIISFILLYFLSIFAVSLDNDDTYSSNNLYYEVHAPTIMVNRFGLLTAFRIDLSRYILGFDPSLDITDENIEDIFLDGKDEKIEYNKLELNFDFVGNEAVQSLNSYLSNKKPTNKNEYTGIFEGKNIIYILAEGFNSIAVDKNITPTLYKLVNSGFTFDNFYSPLFVSTAGGEFQFSLSLIPTQESIKLWQGSTNTYMPYAIGNIFNNLGYKVKAYHNWSYNYYKRQNTMPMLGFKDYTACKNGLEKKMNCNIWPPSDVEMFEATIDEYINEENFAVHYITVSGHAEYNFYGNNMAMKNKKYIENLEYSTSIKAYFATQIELDKSLELLIKKLEDAEKLTDTVIVLAGDHYPYTLSLDEINEVSAYTRDETFEVNRSNLIIYNPEVENIRVDKLASSVDILPTVLNLFGVEFDSRLLMGSDIFSNHNPLVIFSDNSWLTEKGRYDAKTSVFTPNEGTTVNDDYVSSINREVQNRINASTMIISNNYYANLKT